MKLTVFIFLFFLAASHIQVAAHPGGLDENLGHTCISNCSQWGLTDGKYHTHAGNPQPTKAPFYYEPFSFFNSPTFDFPFMLVGFGLVGALTYGVYRKHQKPKRSGSKPRK